MPVTSEHMGEGAVELVAPGCLESDGLASQGVDQVVEGPVGETLSSIRRVDRNQTDFDSAVFGVDVDGVAVDDPGDLAREPLFDR